MKKNIRALVFPELCISSYTCGDLFLQKTLIDACEKSVFDIAKHTSDTEDDAALYVIYVYIRYSYNNNITENLIINEIINDKSVSENFVKEGYNKVVESFSEKISSIRTQLTLDKVQFNELIANEQEVSRPSIVQPDFDDSSSNDTP